MLAERERQPRVDAGVVQRVAGLVHERLVVGEAALRARDQVHDLRRVRRDHAGARVLLRPVLEVEADVRDRCHVEAERASRREADVDRALLRIRRLERRQPAQIVRRARSTARRRARGRAAARTTSRAAGSYASVDASDARRRARARARGARSPSPPRCARPGRARPRARPRGRSRASSSVAAVAR